MALCGRPRDHTYCPRVALNMRSRKRVNLLQPLCDVIERHLIRDIKHHNDAVGAPVVAARNRAESLLSRCVPDLQLHPLPVDCDRLYLKIHSNCAYKAVCEHIVRKPEQQTTLAYSTIPNDEELEQMIIFLLRSLV